MSALELLSPAKNYEFGVAAIHCGADAVYIGAPKFGARVSAGNPFSSIEKLISYAHRYWVKVYVTVNTILYDKEIEEAGKLIRSLYDAGADAIIIQDTGLLELDLPPIPVFASTQMHNYDIGQIQFLEKIGIQRIILARELSLKELQEIRKSTGVELETFIHGALCVSFSGQCYFSQFTHGRSANRGDCAQPCRHLYSLTDSAGTRLSTDSHLLSLKDLNLSDSVGELIKAGISSFKIEGRLKDIHYVKNITAHYRLLLDQWIDKNPGHTRSSSGKSIIPFTPDPDKTFNRGYTDYFLHGRTKEIASVDTPKSAGTYIGTIMETGHNYFILDASEALHNGDGICFYDRQNILCGVQINTVSQSRIYPDDMTGLHSGLKIFRNRDVEFNSLLDRAPVRRKISVTFHFAVQTDEIVLSAHDEDGISARVTQK